MKLPKAVLAHADIRGDESGADISGSALPDLESRFTLKGKSVRALHGGDVGKGGRLHPQGSKKAVDRRGSTLHLEIHALRGVHHVTGKVEPFCKLVDEGTKAHSLDDSPDRSPAATRQSFFT